MIAFRMMMDTLKIKNGKNLFLIDKPKELFFLAIALGVNPFIAGLIANEPFLPLSTALLPDSMTPLIIIGTAFLWGIIGFVTKFSQTKLIVNSLLNVIAALAIFVTGFVAII